MPETITVVAVDDHPLTHVAINALLEERPEIVLVGQGYCGEDVLRLVEELTPDVLVLDLGMPETIEGTLRDRRFEPLPVLDQIKRCHPRTSVIILSQHLHHGIVREAVSRGVKGYLLKSDNLSLNLADAISSVSRGGVYFSSEFGRELFQARRNRHSDLLTRRQRQVVLAIAERPDASYAEIANSLHISESTLKGHLAKVFKTLGVTNYTACLIVCMQHGLVTYSLGSNGIEFDG